VLVLGWMVVVSKFHHETYSVGVGLCVDGESVEESPQEVYHTFKVWLIEALRLSFKDVSDYLIFYVIRR